MQKLLVATNNIGKQGEIKALLEDLSLELITPDQFRLVVEIIEDGHTYIENAKKKVLAYANAITSESGLFILADDSGLEVDVLNGQPGIHSARLSRSPNASDADRRRFLLEKLSHHPQPWTARFRCMVALHDPTTGFHYSEGICSGEVIPEERGDNGFGYDPIFLVAGLGRTMAELTMDEKNKLSHRARAILAIKPILLEILKR